MTEARKGQKGYNRKKIFLAFLAILGHSESFGKKKFLAFFGLAAFMAFKGQKGRPFPAQLSKLHHMSK